MDSAFRIDLPDYRGPLDLLLYLVRKHEVEVADLPIAAITRQYLEFLDVLQALDVDQVGDFLEMASTLIEIKSRQALPRVEDVDESVLEDPREELVHRLLDYKQFRDAASMLDDRSRQWRQRFTRRANDLPPRKTDLTEQPISEVETWDLVSAFGRIMREQIPPPVTNVVYDETPITKYMEIVHGIIRRDGRCGFSRLFEPGMHKSSMIGVFLAILELVRHHSIQASQDGLYGEILLTRGPSFDDEIDLGDVDDYGHARPGDPASMVE